MRISESFYLETYGITEKEYEEYMLMVSLDYT